MARQAAAKMTTANATGTGTGDITVVFADQMTRQAFGGHADERRQGGHPDHHRGQSMPSSFPFQGALDLSQGVLDYTCAGNQASFTNPAVTWHLKPDPAKPRFSNRVVHYL